MSNNRTVIEGIHYETGEPIRIIVNGDRIEAVEHADLPENCKLPSVGLGLIDLQLNGYGGIDFNQPTISTEGIHHVTTRLLEQGVTSYYATIFSNSDEMIENCLRTVAQARNENELIKSCIPGIHLEGPFISPQEGPLGAHNKLYVKAPDWELFQRWQEAAGGLIKLITIAPERSGALEFISKCVDSGVTVSIGHTNASLQQIREAVAAGARMSTHLGNGAHQLLPRHPNYIWDQLAQDELWVCAIADGFHLPASVLKVFMKAKPQQLILVSDAVYLGGLQPGEYVAPVDFKVTLTAEGKLHTTDHPGVLYGAVMTLAEMVEVLVSRFKLCSLGEAWSMASIHPAKAMNLPSASGVTAGAPADLVLFDGSRGRLSIRSVYKNGQLVTTGDPGEL